VAVERCVEVRGPDAFDLVNLVTCRDLTKVQPMQARYVLLTAPWGGIVNDPVLLRLDRNRFWLPLADSDPPLYPPGGAGGRGGGARPKPGRVVCPAGGGGAGGGGTSPSSRPASRRCRSRGHVRRT